jgi:hypothetical protein
MTLPMTTKKKRGRKAKRTGKPVTFGVITPYIDEIEKGFSDNKGAKKIADELGIPEKWRTIQRYKIAVWNMKDLCSDARDVRAAKHEEARNVAVQELVENMDMIALAKVRARELLGISIGDEFDTVSDGKHKLTLSSGAQYWPIGLRLFTDAARLEMELAGDDPQSKSADTLLELVNAVEDTKENNSDN